MNTVLILIGLALLFIIFNRSSIMEKFDNSSNIQLTDLATYQCNYLGEEAKKIDVFMDSCNAPNRGEGQRETINNKWACVDNVNRKIFNDREKNLWCTAKDNKPFVSTMNMTITGNSEPTNDHDINAVYNVVPFPTNMNQDDFPSLNKANRTFSEGGEPSTLKGESDKVNFNGQLNVPISSKIDTRDNSDVFIEGTEQSKQLTYNQFVEQTMEPNLDTMPNFINNVNVETRAHGMLNKYELLGPPFSTGFDASINHLYATI